MNLSEILKASVSMYIPILFIKRQICSNALQDMGTQKN